MSSQQCCPCMALPRHAARPYLSGNAGRSQRGVARGSSVQRGCVPRLAWLERVHSPHWPAFPGVGGTQRART